MTTVIGVSFKRAGKMYYFDPNGLELHIGDKAIVETARGMECGDAVSYTHLTLPTMEAV